MYALHTMRFIFVQPEAPDSRPINIKHIWAHDRSKVILVTNSLSLLDLLYSFIFVSNSNSPHWNYKCP